MTESNTQGVPVEGSTESIAAIFERCQCNEAPVGLALARLDGLARMSALFGTDVVDAVLNAVTEKLSALTPGCVVQELDGQFVLIVPDLPKGGLDEGLDAMLAKLRSQRVRKGGRFVRLGISMGLSLSDCGASPRSDELLFETLIGVAAEGLAVARSGGGAQWVHTQLYGLLQDGMERREPGSIAAQAARIAELRAHPLDALPEPELKPGHGLGLAAELELEIEESPEGELELDYNEGSEADLALELEEGPEGEDEIEDEIEEILLASCEPATGPALTEEGRSALDEEPEGCEPVGGPFIGAPDTDASRAAAEDGLAEFMADGSEADRNELLGLMLGWVESERARAALESRTEYESQIQILERRLRKLSGTLADTESELARVARLKSVDPGVASSFRTVQGLPEDEEHHDLKKAMMQSIFEANVELARRLRANHA